MMTDHERIFEWLADGEWHCSTEIDFMRDARKRISEINKKKIIIEGISCDGRCGTQHRSKSLKMRRWVQEVSNDQFEVKTPPQGKILPKNTILVPIKEIVESKTERFLFQTSLL